MSAQFGLVGLLIASANSPVRLAALRSALFQVRSPDACVFASGFVGNNASFTCLAWILAMRGTQFAELSAFVAVAEYRNFTKAAAQLGVSPSPLSQTVRSFEERLGPRAAG